MKYRVAEKYYGPDLRPGDWKGEGCQIAPNTDKLRIQTDAAAIVTRTDYRYGGGGDVEISVTFQVDRLEPKGAFTIHFNRAQKNPDASGFRLTIDNEHVVLFARDRECVRQKQTLSQSNIPHTVRLVTLDESYAVFLDGECLTEEHLAATGWPDAFPPSLPLMDNEGWTSFIVKNADVRVLRFEECFIVHDVVFPSWERTELLHEEPFTAKSIREDWVCNGMAPLPVSDGCVFQHLSVTALKRRLDGPIAIDFLATPMPTAEFSAGVTDAIFIWMMDKPGGNLIEYMRSLPDANLGHYLPLSFYWVDFGGTNNATTRLRRNPHRRLIRQFVDPGRLLERNRSYRTTLAQNGNMTEFWVDGSPWIQTWDPSPLRSGHVAFRAFVSGLKVGGLKIWRIR